MLLLSHQFIPYIVEMILYIFLLNVSNVYRLKRRSNHTFIHNKAINACVIKVNYVLNLTSLFFCVCFKFKTTTELEYAELTLDN